MGSGTALPRKGCSQPFPRTTGRGQVREGGQRVKADGEQHGALGLPAGGAELVGVSQAGGMRPVAGGGRTRPPSRGCPLPRVGSAGVLPCDSPIIKSEQ